MWCSALRWPMAALRRRACCGRATAVTSHGPRTTARPKTFLVTVPLLIEYEAVMTRPGHLKAAHLSVADVGVLPDVVTAVAEPLRLAFLWRPTLPDADDDMMLETVDNGRANRNVTFNQGDFGSAAPVVASRWARKLAGEAGVLNQLMNVTVAPVFGLNVESPRAEPRCSASP